MALAADGKKRMILMKTTLFLFLIGWTTIAHADPRPLTLKDPIVRIVPGTDAPGAGFVTFINKTDQPITLKTVTSPDAERIEIHQMDMQYGIMRMRPVDKLALAANGETSLEPGGLHLMLFGIKKSVAGGDKIQVTLIFDNGDRIEQDFVLKTPSTK